MSRTIAFGPPACPSAGDRFGDAAIARVRAPGAVPDDRDCPRGAHGRRRSRGCLCPGAVTNHGSVGVDIVAALLTHE